MKNSLYMLFEHKCVLEVCTHPPYNAKNPASVFFFFFFFFLNPYFKIPFQKSGCSEIPVKMT